MKIGDLASACGVNVQTIRYYERRGLLPDPREGAAGYREYDHDDVDRLRFVKEAQALGFTLKEIPALLALRSGRGTAREVRERAREKLDGVRARIVALRALERNLVKLIAGCSGSGASTACSILNQLEARRELEPTTKRATARRTKRRTS